MHLPFDVIASTEVSDLFHFSSPKIIINLISISSVFSCEENPALSKRVNSDFVDNLLGALGRYQSNVQEPIRFVQASSSEMFSGYEPETVITVNSYLNPKTTYGRHKALAHLATQNYNQKYGNAATAVLFNHESPRRPQNFVSKKIISGLVDIKLGLSENLKLGNMSSRRDWGYAKDYASGILKLSENSFLDNLIFASGQLHSIEDFLVRAADILGIENYQKKIEIDPSLIRKLDNDGIIGDPTKAFETMQWKNSLSFSDLIEVMAAAELEKRKIL